MIIEAIFDDVVFVKESGSLFDYTFVCGECAKKPELMHLKKVDDVVDGIVCGCTGCSSDTDVLRMDLPTIDGKDVIELFHGTTEVFANQIRETGLKPLTCLTVSKEVANYYAECACDESGDNYSECAIITLFATADELEVDYNAYEEPLTFYKHDYTRSDSEWAAMCESGEIPYPTNKHDVKPAIEATGCVMVTNFINKDRLSLELN